MLSLTSARNIAFGSTDSCKYRKRIKIQIKKNEKNIRTRVAPCRYLLSHTYTPKPDKKRIKIQIKKNEKT